MVVVEVDHLFHLSFHILYLAANIVMTASKVLFSLSHGLFTILKIESVQMSCVYLCFVGAGSAVLLICGFMVALLLL